MTVRLTAYQDFRPLEGTHSPVKHEELVRLDDGELIVVTGDVREPTVRPLMCTILPHCTRGLHLGNDYTFNRSKRFWQHDPLIFDLVKEVLAVVLGFVPVPVEGGGHNPYKSAAAAARKAGPGPFHELMCRYVGDFNSAACLKLAQDFAAHDEVARRVEVDSFYLSHYRIWREAFEFAGDNGFVRIEIN